MPANNIDPLNHFLNTWKSNDLYFEMLQLMAQLSRLFSTNDAPYLDYRLTENLFCKYYNALNDARSCTAYDARLGNLGIGIKTFLLKNNRSTEKIAEFNKLKSSLSNLHGIELAQKLGEYRNDRMDLANRTYKVNQTQYHIVGRLEGTLRIFNVDYEQVNIHAITDIEDNDTKISFNDGINEYTFNKSKSVLLKEFRVPNDYKDINVEIIEDPLDVLSQLLINNNKEKIIQTKKRIQGVDYVVLPLYSYNKNKGYFVAEKSGLNQFNAGGRHRNELEVYIPVPAKIHRNYPNFFPNRDSEFSLELPDGNIISAKICQDGGKALMSNPNSALGEWLFNQVLRKDPYKIIKMDDLNRLGFNSVCIEDLHKTDEKNGKKLYRISISEEDYSYND